MLAVACDGQRRRPHLPRQVQDLPHPECQREATCKNPALNYRKALKQWLRSNHIEAVTQANKAERERIRKVKADRGPEIVLKTGDKRSGKPCDGICEQAGCGEKGELHWHEVWWAYETHHDEYLSRQRGYENARAGIWVSDDCFEKFLKRAKTGGIGDEKKLKRKARASDRPAKKVKTDEDEEGRGQV
ncbi:hypothetical protein B9Z65_4122 [Elsinoe australis]|uniref:Uncharacterized protein n=1 Tax=Elsinoe australis TaxID=40998 RepID=A0A2P7Z1X8_9PEZI|nr:hypothetical protein B9Z65_4122 [Elsinoe australis]